MHTICIGFLVYVDCILFPGGLPQGAWSGSRENSAYRSQKARPYRRVLCSIVPRSGKFDFASWKYLQPKMLPSQPGDVGGANATTRSPSSRKTADARHEDLKNSNPRAGNNLDFQHSNKSTHPCRGRLATTESPPSPARSRQEPNKEDGAGALEESNLLVLLLARGRETEKDLQTLTNIISNFQKEQKNLGTKSELLHKDVRCGKEPAIVVLQAGEDFEIRRKRESDGEWFISVYKREGRDNNVSRRVDAPETGVAEVESLRRSDREEFILQINIRSAKLAADRLEKRSDHRLETTATIESHLSGIESGADLKTVCTKKKCCVLNAKEARPLPPGFQASQGLNCCTVAAAKTLNSAADENEEKRIELAKPGELKACLFPVFKRRWPCMFALRNRCEIVQGSESEDGGSSNTGGNGNDTSEEDGGDRGGHSNAVTGEGIYGKKRRHSNAIDDRVQNYGLCDGGKGGSNERPWKRSSRGEWSRGHRDNWTAEENCEFVDIVQTNAGMEEMNLRRMLATKLAPRRTHEECVSHLRVLRLLGRLPHATDEAIAGSTRLPGSSSNAESEDV